MTNYSVLNNGLKMPWLGYGVYKIEDGKSVEAAVSKALELGYRSIDTAAVYKNEAGVGNAIRDSGIAREDIFLTTKVWNDEQRNDRVAAAFEESLERLGTDYVDLYLVHWPVVERSVATWKAMEKIYQSGRAKAIGVSNYKVHHLQEILNNCEVVPAVNQVEFHPRLRQPELMQFCKANKIQLEAWSPLMQGHFVEETAILALAEKYGKSPAQVVLRWDIQHDVVTIPKSATPSRIAENSQIFDFELSADDMAILDALDQEKRFGSDPDNFNF